MFRILTASLLVLALASKGNAGIVMQAPKTDKAREVTPHSAWNTHAVSGLHLNVERADDTRRRAVEAQQARPAAVVRSGSDAAALSTPVTRVTTHGPWLGPCASAATGEFDSGATAPAIRQVHTRTLVICAFRWVHESVATALYVANRESRFFPDAYNPSGCAGTFQQSLAYWHARLVAFFPRRWIAPWLYRRGSAFNPYLNVFVSAFMVKAGGWAPWE